MFGNIANLVVGVEGRRDGRIMIWKMVLPIGGLVMMSSWPSCCAARWPHIVGAFPLRAAPPPSSRALRAGVIRHRFRSPRSAGTSEPQSGWHLPSMLSASHLLRYLPACLPLSMPSYFWRPGSPPRQLIIGCWRHGASRVRLTCGLPHPRHRAAWRRNQHDLAALQRILLA